MIENLDDLITRYGLKKINDYANYPDNLDFIESNKEPNNKPLYYLKADDVATLRIVFFNYDYVIGDKDKFLYANGDRVISTSLCSPGVLDFVIDLADRLVETLEEDNNLYVVYLTVIQDDLMLTDRLKQKYLTNTKVLDIMYTDFNAIERAWGSTEITKNSLNEFYAGTSFLSLEAIKLKRLEVVKDYKR